MMQKINNFFFSKILHRNIHSVADSVIGKLGDCVVDFSLSTPIITALEVTSGSRRFAISADFLEVSSDEHERYHLKLNSENLRVMPLPQNGFFLARNFLDKQIVDVNGKKVERVNDIRIGLVMDRWNVLAVDIGIRGLLRRLGAEYLAIRIASVSGKRFRNKLVTWNSVEPLTSGVSDLQLSKPMNKLKTLHAADIADIIEDLDKSNQMQIMHGLGDEKAAKVLEELEEESQRSILKSLPDEKASDLLEIMPSDEAADILDEIEDSRAEKLLGQMDSENSDEIRELMEYEDKTVGSIMAKDFLTFSGDDTTNDALEKIRNERPEEEETAQYMYLVNSDNRLIGSVALVDIATASSDVKLSQIALENLYTVRDDDRIDVVMDTMQKYHVAVLPVVDESGELVGITSLNDLIGEYIRLRKIPA